jgi:hypothetical protein
MIHCNYSGRWPQPKAVVIGIFVLKFAVGPYNSRQNGKNGRRKMNSPEKDRQVFVVRLWREAREIEGRLPEWRGIIESVQTGKHRYLQNLDDIVAFIIPHLEGVGFKPKFRQRIRHWVNRCKLSWPRQK